VAIRAEGTGLNGPTLAELLSAEQLSTLVSLLTQVIAHGHGDVTVHVKNGSIRFIRATISHEVTGGNSPPLQPG
jgi:hypothetical protein